MDTREYLRQEFTLIKHLTSQVYCLPGVSGKGRGTGKIYRNNVTVMEALDVCKRLFSVRNFRFVYNSAFQTNRV